MVLGSAACELWPEHRFSSTSPAYIIIITPCKGTICLHYKLARLRQFSEVFSPLLFIIVNASLIHPLILRIKAIYSPWHTLLIYSPPNSNFPDGRGRREWSIVPTFNSNLSGHSIRRKENIERRTVNYGIKCASTEKNTSVPPQQRLFSCPSPPFFPAPPCKGRSIPDQHQPTGGAREPGHGLQNMSKLLWSGRISNFCLNEWVGPQVSTPATTIIMIMIIMIWKPFLNLKIMKMKIK